MSKVEEYRLVLRGLAEWDPYLLEQSGLPGPRGNIELGRAAAQEASPERIWGWLEWNHERAPANTREEFLAFCGVLGLGRLAAEGDELALAQLHRHASDERWRAREAVAMAIQQMADADFDTTITVVGEWAHEGWLEQRAAIAGLCEPHLLTTTERTAAVFDILDVVTQAIANAPAADRKNSDYRTLRQGLGYCWSVATVADPAAGPRRMERWIDDSDDDIRWVMRTNLSKKRLQRMDGAWVEAQLERLPRP
jgi:hypothetical protein